MILPIGNFNDIVFNSAKEQKKQPVSPYKNDTLLENNFSTNSRIALDKFTKAFTVYPAKGLKGSKNSNFYEFLTMGTVPYFIGSATLIAVFNSVNKIYFPNEKKMASALGHKMALGVVLYGLFKEISKSFINKPVKAITGVDTQLPYAKVIHQLQESPDDFDLTSIEYHKVGESVDFTRWDLLYGDPKSKKTLNARYDKIAKKVGLGENLNDSDQEVKPIYREILVKSSVGRSFSSFLWAAVGVCLAMQPAWEDYFNVATFKFWKPKKFLNSMKVFGESFLKSWKELYKGSADSKVLKYGGKAVIGLAALSTVLGVLNACHITKKPSSISRNDVMDSKKESVKC